MPNNSLSKKDPGNEIVLCNDYISPKELADPPLDDPNEPVYSATLHSRGFAYDERNANVCGSGSDYFDEDEDGEPEDSLQESEPRRGVGIYKSAFNIFKGNVATAVFLLPTFYKDAGYVISPIIALLMGACVTDCSRLLLRSKRLVNRDDVQNYFQVCDFILGLPFRYVLLVALLLTQFGFCLMYLQLFADSMERMIPRFTGDEKIYISVIFIIVLPISFFSDRLAFLAIISMIATVCVFFALITTIILTFIKLHNDGIDPTTHSIGTDVPFGWFNNMANNMMALEGIGVILPVENACSNKPRVPFMVVIVLSFVVGWYLLYGLTGYLAYGNVLTVSLIDALPKDPLSTVVRVAFTINILCTYPILFMPAILQLDSVLGWKPRSWKGILMRVVISAIIYLIAMVVGAGAVNVVISFIGALPATVMIMVLPPLLSLFVESSIEDPDAVRTSWAYWRNNLFGKRITFIRVRSGFYILCGITIMVVGTYSVVKNLV